MSIAERIPAFVGSAKLQSATQLEGPAAAPRPATDRRVLPRRTWRGELALRNVVLGLADRIAVLHHGRLLAVGSPTEVTADETVKRAYLGDAL